VILPVKHDTNNERHQNQWHNNTGDHVPVDIFVMAQIAVDYENDRIKNDGQNFGNPNQNGSIFHIHQITTAMVVIVIFFHHDDFCIWNCFSVKIETHLEVKI